MKYNSVIFDWDGTLGMTLHLWLLGYKSELKKLGFEYSDRVIVDDFFYEHEKASLKYPHIDFDRLLIEVRKYILTHLPSLELYTDAKETLEKLRQGGVDITLASSSPKEMLEESLKQTGLKEYFSYIVGYDEVSKHKPDPESFLKIINDAGLDKGKTIIIGDSHNDIIAGKEIGVDTCLFLPEENRAFYDFSKLEETNPTYKVASLKQFTELVFNS